MNNFRPFPMNLFRRGGAGAKALAVVTLAAGIGVAAHVMLPRRVPSGADSPRSAASGPVVVSAAKIESGDIEVRLSAIGTVTPLSTVTVRPRVDGELTKVCFTEGATVKEGQLLAEIDPRPYEVQLMQAQGQLARDEALLANARRDRERYREAGEAVTRRDADAADAAAAQLEGVVKADRAQVENARLQLGYCRIVSPMDGVAGLRLVDAGNQVRAGDAGGLVVITRADPISVMFAIPESDVPALLAATAKNPALRVEAYDRDSAARPAVGALAAADNRVDAATGSLRLRANFPNPDGKLFPNRFVNVRLVLETRRGVALVPSAAILPGDRSPSVYVLRDDGSAVRREIAAGAVSGGKTEALKGLSVGESVVTDGLDRLRDGDKVIIAGAEKPAGAGKPDRARSSGERGKPGREKQPTPRP